MLNRYRPALRALGALIIASLTPAWADAGPIGYGVTDLGRGGGPLAINNAGQVVGISYAADGVTTHGFLYSQGTLTNLDDRLGAPFRPEGINNRGQVVGKTDRPAGNNQVYIFDSATGAATVLPAFGSGTSAGIPRLSINDAGQVAGGIQVVGPGGYIVNDRSLAPRETNAQIVDVNASGRVAGVAHTSLNEDIAFTATGVGPEKLPMLLPTGQPHAINDSGVIVGEINGSGYVFRGMGEKTALNFGLPPDDLLAGPAYDVNNHDQIVGDGFFRNLFGITHGYVYENGILIDLNSLLTPGSGWLVTGARGINDAGQIVAFGRGADGAQHALLLTPTAVPEPSALALLLVAGGGLRARRPLARWRIDSRSRRSAATAARCGAGVPPA